MNIPRKKLHIIRFLLNPNFVKFQSPNTLISSAGSSLCCSIRPSAHTLGYIHRCFSASSADERVVSDHNARFGNIRHTPVARKRTVDRLKPPNGSPKMISQVIDVVRSSKGDCSSKLDSMGARLSTRSVCEIFQVLSCERVPALQFFKWVRDNNRDLYRNADVCSLMVDNCGWLDDYETMTVLLKGFNQEGICLTDKAFRFLPVLDSSKAHAMESIASVIRILDSVRGSSRRSGIFGMINMLCAIDSFEMARFVMELTEHKLSYYAILIREKGRRGCYDEAYALLGEMREAGCDPDAKIYNHVLSILCKSDKLSEAQALLEEMTQKGVHPDEMTFEVIIANSCRLGKLELANQILERLTHTGLVPRLSTHVAVVKGYFNSGQYEEAYKYVHDIEVMKMPATNRMYSLLARLHQGKGNIDVARRVLIEMMEKGLKPHYPDYAKTINVLRHRGGRHLALDLKDRFSKFRVE